MALQRPFLVSLRREDSREPWGFRLDGGGVTNRPVAVQQVLERSLAERSGLHEGDQVIQIGRINVQGRTLSEVQELILTCKNRVEMFIIREDLLRNRKENEPLTVKAVVHSPYNSPFQLYSQDNVADTLATQACILADPGLQPNHLGPSTPPAVIHSNVLDALREQGEKGARLNGEVLTTPPIKKKQPPPVPPKPRRKVKNYPPVKSSIYPGSMEQVQYQNYSTIHREEKRTTTQKSSNYEEYEEEEEEETEEEEEEEPVVVTKTTKTFKSQTSFTPQQPDQQVRSQQQTQHIVRTQQTVQQDTRQKEYQQQQQQQQLEQQRRAELARQQQQQQAQEQQQRQLREQQQRQAFEQQQRQQQAREQQARDQQAREQQARQQAAREQQAREQQAREQQAREQQARDQQQRLAAQQRQAYEQQQAREAYERQQRQQQQAYEQQRQAQLRAQQQPQQQQWQQQPPQQRFDTDPSKKLSSTARVVPANLGSPVLQRKGNCPSWPPKNSSVRELPKTGFSPSFVQERGSKQFVWPPPKAEDFVQPTYTAPPHITGHAADAWHPQETPAVSRPMVPRSPTPTRRLGDQVWPPRHTLVNDEAGNDHQMSRPVARRGRFDDYVHSTASSNVPPTYRVPPGTVHVNIVY